MRATVIGLLMLMWGSLHGQNFTGPIPAPIMGYGSFGTHAVDSMLFVNPADSTYISFVYFPKGITAPAPTVFFLGGNGANTPYGYQPFMHMIVSKGFTVVFVPSPTSQPTLTRYHNLNAGFRFAVKNYPLLIDTTRIGFVGHSFGGGASFALAYDFYKHDNWGANGRFIVTSAQWYSYAITQFQLENFPENTKLLSFIYDEDRVCDHRMAVDIFRNISIPKEEKDLVYIRSSVAGEYSYDANHVAPNTISCYDAVDHFTLFRLTDAMMDLVFHKNESARAVALGNGSGPQVTMPMGLSPLEVSDTIYVRRSESYYAYNYSSYRNPRRNYYVDEPYITSMISIAVHPAKTQDSIFVFGAEGAAFTLVNALGEEVLSGTLPTCEETIDLTPLAPAVYILNCNGERLMIIRQY